MMIDYSEKTISIKIGYFGPAFSSKPALIKTLFSHLGKERKLKRIKNTVNYNVITISFDYGTVTFQNKEWKLKIHLYSIDKPITIRAVEGIILALDSRIELYELDLLSWDIFVSNYKNIDEIPIIITFNKQNHPKFDYHKFLKDIKFKDDDRRFQEMSTISGDIIMEWFQNILRSVLKSYYKKILKKNNGLEIKINLHLKNLRIKAFESPIHPLSQFI